MNRTLALIWGFGWQGGTIHQLAKETGCSAHDLLYSERQEHTTSIQGWFAARTCDRKHNVNVVFPQHKGDLQFWLGFADGVMSMLKPGLQGMHTAALQNFMESRS